MPQFHLSSGSLPDSSSDDAAATLERAPVRVRPGSRPSFADARRRSIPAYEPELEIEPQDILVETYLEPVSDPVGAQLAWMPPPSGHEPLDVETFAPASLPPQFRMTSSLAPVVMTSAEPAPQSVAPVPIDPPRRSGPMAIVGSITVALLVGLVVGAVALGPTQVVGRGRAAVAGWWQTHRQVAPAAAAPAVAVAAPAPSPIKIAEAPPPPAVSVSSLPVAATPVSALPAPSVDPSMTVLSFRKAKDLRVFIDGRQVGRAVEPIKTKCGKHKVRIGARNKPRAMDLPCGEELALD